MKTPAIIYTIKQLHWKSAGRQATFQLPAVARFMPQDIFTAAMTWQRADLSLISEGDLDKHLVSHPLELVSIQYVIELHCNGRCDRAQLMHEFIGTGAKATFLTNGGSVILNKAVLFEEYTVGDVFEECPASMRRMKVVQFVS